ncbi:sulfatase-like hydrolase/transferase [Methylocystis parvus]|uniref:Sulfatase-like hydrolase/transferase n=1 Tax=Methylocystis parvus TaxID=134 RepID=A0A6B8M5I1_9HYPH|nr:sulfatase-like hydrolase/transferase [Methylocystis parvus]QGM98191.1 sulfatase-like hydrolase/transferase [Methylocystis parvus]WBK01484.1 sulfatase-like hydrolase/transferase [Methylocystis parvus OBBP]
MRFSDSLLFSRPIAVFAAAMASLAGGASAQSIGQYPPSSSRLPNILMILTDDVGIDQIRTMGYGGVTAPPTPNIDAIANAGVRFRDMWAMPACSTSRGVLYTGRYPLRTNLYAALGPSDLANSMISPWEETLPKLMKRAGYTNALFGKFHVGLQGNDPFKLAMPASLGWDYFSGWLDETGDPSSIDTTAGGVGAQGQYVWGYVPGSRNGGADFGACYAPNLTCRAMSASYGDKNPPGRACRDDGGIFVPGVSCQGSTPANLLFGTLSAHYVSPLVINRGATIEQPPPTDQRARTYRNIQATNDAIAWIRQQQGGGRPWMATLAVATVHTPLQAPPLSRLPANALDTNGLDPSNPTTGFILSNQMIEAMDADVGRLLTETGLAARNAMGKLHFQLEAANTMVIYVNDNGSLGSTVRLPFDATRAKGTPYQTGVWTPLAIAGPLVNQPGRSVTSMVNIADLYELFGEMAGLNVHSIVTRKLDSRPMLAYLRNPGQPEIRQSNFTQVGPNIQANGGVNGPCQFANSCSQIPVTKSVCEDNGGVWFGQGATGTYPTSGGTPIPTEGFTYCCQVQVWLNDNGYEPTKVNPEIGVALRNALGYKLVRNNMKNYSTATNSCVETTSDELYFVDESVPVPLIDKEERLIPTPYNALQQQNYDALSKELDAILASQPACPGDGNGDGVVNQQDVSDYNWMASLSGGASSWYDVNRDGLTNSADLSIIQANLGTVCGARAGIGSTSAVPGIFANSGAGAAGSGGASGGGAAASHPAPAAPPSGAPLGTALRAH